MNYVPEGWDNMLCWVSLYDRFGAIVLLTMASVLWCCLVSFLRSASHQSMGGHSRCLSCAVYRLQKVHELILVVLKSESGRAEGVQPLLFGAYLTQLNSTFVASATNFQFWTGVG